MLAPKFLRLVVSTLSLNLLLDMTGYDTWRCVYQNWKRSLQTPMQVFLYFRIFSCRGRKLFCKCLGAELNPAGRMTVCFGHTVNCAVTGLFPQPCVTGEVASSRTLAHGLREGLQPLESSHSGGSGCIFRWGFFLWMRKSGRWHFRLILPSTPPPSFLPV